MKTIKTVVAILVVAIITGGIFSCELFDKGDVGTLLVRLPGASPARVALSDDFVNSLKYEIDCSKKGETISGTYNPGETVSILLSPGTWVITIKLLDNEEILIGKSTEKVNINPGKTTSVSMKITVDSQNTSITSFVLDAYPAVKPVESKDEETVILTFTVPDDADISKLFFAIEHDGKLISQFFDDSYIDVPASWDFSSDLFLRVFANYDEAYKDYIVKVEKEHVDTPITSVSVTLASVPETATVRSNTASVPNDANYTVSEVTWTGDFDDDDKFKALTVYTAEVTLTAKDSYTFTGLTSALISGVNATLSGNNGKSVTLTASFTTLAGIYESIMIKTEPTAALTHGDLLSDIEVTVTFNTGAVDYSLGEFGSSNIRMFIGEEEINANTPLIHTKHDDKHISVQYGSHDDSAVETERLVVNPAVLTITGVFAENREYDGTNIVELTGGVLQGVKQFDVDRVDFELGYGTIIGNVNAGEDKDVAIEITLKGDEAGNYILTQPSVTVNITRKQISITGVSATDRVYNASEEVELTGGDLVGVEEDDLDDVEFELNDGEMDNANVGINKVVNTSITLTGDKAGNYTLTQPSDITVNITPKTISITGVSAIDRPYNGTTEVELEGGELVDVEESDLEGVDFDLDVGEIKEPGVGEDKPVTTYITLTGDKAGNYNLEQPAGITVNIYIADPFVEWPQGLFAINTQTLLDISLDNYSNNPPGTFTWKKPNDPVGNDGDNQHEMIFTPHDVNNYNTLTEMVNVLVTAVGEGVFSIELAAIIDLAPELTIDTAIVLRRVTTGGPFFVILELKDPKVDDIDEISWVVQGKEIGKGASVLLVANNHLFDNFGTHIVTVKVTLDGVVYSRAISFKVEF